MLWDARAQRCGLTYVERRAGRVAEDVDAGQRRQLGGQRAGRRGVGLRERGGIGERRRWWGWRFARASQREVDLSDSAADTVRWANGTDETKTASDGVELRPAKVRELPGGEGLDVQRFAAERRQRVPEELVVERAKLSE